MRFVLKCLIGAAILVSPCVYDMDPREPTALMAIAHDMMRPSADGSENPVLRDVGKPADETTVAVHFYPVHF